MTRETIAGYSQYLGLSLNMFTDDELAELHSATLDVLEDAGIMVLNDEAQEIFHSHGCKVDKKASIVKIPPYLVEEAIRSAPSKILLAELIAESAVLACPHKGYNKRTIHRESEEVPFNTRKEKLNAKGKTER